LLLCVLLWLNLIVVVLAPLRGAVFLFWFPGVSLGGPRFTPGYYLSPLSGVGVSAQQELRPTVPSAFICASVVERFVGSFSD